jgi:hypothetical protein
VFGCGILSLLLVVGLLGLMLFFIGFDVLYMLLLDETIVLNLSLEILGVGVLGFEVLIGGVIILRGMLVFGEEEIFGITLLLHRL